MVSDSLIRFIYTPLFAWIGRRVHTSSVLQVQQLHTADIPSEAYLLPIPKEHKLCSFEKKMARSVARVGVGLGVGEEV